jgi:endo-1,4-beta-D-glucanase Y
MRVPSAAPVSALALFAFAVAVAAVACSAPGRPGESGQAGSGGANSGTAGRGGSSAGTGGGAGGTGVAGGPGGAGATGGQAGSAAGGGNGGAGTGGATAGGAGSAAAGSTGTGGGAGGAAGSGGNAGGGRGGTAGTAPAVVIPGAGNCMAPAGANPADAAAAYAKWKTDLLTSDGAGGFLRVRRPNSASAVVNSTVSEGIAYGMLLSVHADDQPTFDKLWQYSQISSHLDGNGLMHWYIGPTGEVLGTGAASDADEDMAFALVAANARWGGRGSLTTNYIDLAKTLIGKIWQFEVDHSRADVLKPGDMGFDGSVINISYFAPAYYRVFGRVTGQTANWNNVAKTSYDVLERTLTTQNGNANNGLVPAWSTPAGMPMAPSGTSMPTHHQLDSCRTPFRIAVDYCWNAEPRALTYLQKITGFYAGIGAANIVDGYDLNGNPHPQNVTSGGQRAASFNGPAGAGAMATGATYPTLRNEAYGGVATLMQLAGSTYYQESWTGLSLQMMTGMFPVPP